MTDIPVESLEPRARTLVEEFAELRKHFAPIFDEQRETWEREGPAAMAWLQGTGASLATIGGNCPVQAEGMVDGQPFYFRARGDGWELWVGAEADWFTDRAFCHEQSYGVWPDAGWMPQHEALGFVVDGIVAYRAAVLPQVGRVDVSDQVEATHSLSSSDSSVGRDLTRPDDPVMEIGISKDLSGNEDCPRAAATIEFKAAESGLGHG